MLNVDDFKKLFAPAPKQLDKFHQATPAHGRGKSGKTKKGATHTTGKVFKSRSLLGKLSPAQFRRFSHAVRAQEKADKKKTDS